MFLGYVPSGISRGSPTRDSRPFLTEELDFDAFTDDFSGCPRSLDDSCSWLEEEEPSFNNKSLVLFSFLFESELLCLFSINGGMGFSLPSVFVRLLCSVLCLEILFSLSLSLLWDIRDKVDADDNEDNDDNEEVSLVGDIKLEVASFVTFISTELDLEHI